MPSLVGAHLAVDDLREVAAGRQHLERLGRLDGGGVEGVAEFGHGQVSFCSVDQSCGIASAKACPGSGSMSGRP